MKSLNIKIAVLSATILGFSPILKAQDAPGGFFAEPLVSYEIGDTSVNYPSPFSNSTGKVQGLGLGARAGFHFNEMIFGGLDGRYSMPKFEDSSVNYDATAVSTNWGPFVGVQMPIVGLRAWGSYIVGGQLDPEASSNIDVKFKSGSGYRLGAGFKVVAVSLNLEYQYIKYAETELEKLGPFATSSTFDNVTLENKAWLLSVSFPLAL